MENFKDKNLELVGDVHSFLKRQLNDVELVDKEFLILDQGIPEKEWDFCKTIGLLLLFIGDANTKPKETTTTANELLEKWCIAADNHFGNTFKKND